MQIRSSIVLVLLAACGGDGGGDVRTISASGPLWGARFSPDGATLAVAFGPDDKIGTLDVATGAITELATNGNYLTGTAWTAAGDAIYYNGGGGVFRVAPGVAATMVNDAFASMNVDLSPDGTRLAYGINGANAEIYTLATATTSVLDHRCEAIRFAPVVDEVACISGGSLLAINLSSRVATTIIADGVSFIAGVDWYADGERLVFTSDDGIERVTRGGDRSLLHDAFATIELDLSPDEHSLVYVTNGSGDLSILKL